MFLYLGAQEIRVKQYLCDGPMSSCKRVLLGVHNCTDSGIGHVRDY